MTILALVEHQGDRADDVSLEALTASRRLAETGGEPLHAVLLGASDGTPGPGLGAHGVGAVHVAEDERLLDYAPAAWARAVIEAIEHSGATTAIGPGTDRGNEVMAHVAAMANQPMAANCTEIRPGDPLELTRIRWGGSLLEEATLAGSPRLLTIAPHAVATEPAASPREPEVLRIEPALDERDLVVRVTAREEPPPGTISLGEARVVVGGGRGMGGADGFAPLEELADLLGGAVGCSRAVTSAGWRPHSDQIGQTGARIAPDLYIACGISGAIQHLVGCKAAKRIMAVNTDPDAPMMAQADYAIVGDARHVVAALITELRQTAGT